MMTTMRTKLIDPVVNLGYSNGNVKYNALSKTWNCTICDYSRNKYNRKQVTNHVNAKHNTKK